MITLKVPILALGALALCLAQSTSPPGDHYLAYDSAVLSAATEKLTVQQPVTPARQVQFEFATAQCTVACDVTVSWNGTAASATAGTIKKLPGTLNAPVATMWTGSNAGAGTASRVDSLPAGGLITYDLTAFLMGDSGTATNLSIAVSSITGTAKLSIQWRER